MTDKELRKLNRSALLEMLVEQSRENDRLRAQVDELQRLLSDRQLKINQVFEAAQQAAEQYLENIRSLSGRQEQVCQQIKEESTRQAKLLLAETKRNCQALEAETAEKCTRMKKEAEESADRTWKEVQARIRQLVDDQAGLRDLLISASGGSKSS